MGYQLSPGSAASLDSPEYAAAANVTTTDVNSCMLAIGRTAANALAVVHISFLDRADQPFYLFGPGAVRDAMTAMGAMGNYAVVGAIDGWDGSMGATLYKHAYRSLLGELGVAQGVRMSDGTYHLAFVAPSSVQVTDGAGNTQTFPL